MICHFYGNLKLLGFWEVFGIELFEGGFEQGHVILQAAQFTSSRSDLETLQMFCFGVKFIFIGPDQTEGLLQVGNVRLCLEAKKSFWRLFFLVFLLGNH